MYMSNEYQEDSELFVSDDSPEENSDVGSTTANENNGEETIDEKSKQEDNKEKQVDVFTKKVISGELDLDDIPEKQQWLKPLVEQRLKSSEEAISKLVDERLATTLQQQEDNKLFETLKSSLNGVKLTKAEKEEIEQEFKDLKSHLTPGKALEKAIKIARIDIDVQSVRQSMSLPKAGRQESSKEVDVMELSPDARMAHYEKLRRNR